MSALLELWEPRLGVKAAGLHVQRMKPRWGNWSPARGTIRRLVELLPEQNKALIRLM